VCLERFTASAEPAEFGVEENVAQEEHVQHVYQVVTIARALKVLRNLGREPVSKEPLDLERFVDTQTNVGVAVHEEQEAVQKFATRDRSGPRVDPEPRLNLGDDRQEESREAANEAAPRMIGHARSVRPSATKVPVPEVSGLPQEYDEVEPQLITPQRRRAASIRCGGMGRAAYARVNPLLFSFQASRRQHGADVEEAIDTLHESRHLDARSRGPVTNETPGVL
jgi:hypothetical protein